MPDEIPPGYTPAGTLTVTLRLANGPYPIQGPVLRHDGCGELVTPSAVGRHERLAHLEGEEAEQ